MIDSRSSAQSTNLLTRNLRRTPLAVGVVGVEIGHDWIYMVRLKKSAEGEIVFEKCQKFAFDPTVRLESTSFTPILKTALKTFGGTSRDLAIWAAPPLNRTRIHHLTVPHVSPARLPGAVFWGLQREDHFLEKETVIDFQVEENSDPKAPFNVTGALADRECVENFQLAFSRAGAPLAGLGIPLLGLRDLVNPRIDQEADTPVLICQLGLKATSVTVLFGGQLVFARNIPLGLYNLADTLVKELDPSPERDEACSLILRLGQPGKKLSPEDETRQETAKELIHPVLNRIVRQIDRTIEYYQGNSETLPIQTIFLGGEIATSGTLFDFISEQLSFEIILIDPFDTPDLHTDSPPPVDLGDRVAFGPAFGLALEGSKNGINLAHTYQERQSEHRFRVAATILTLVLIVLSVATAVFYHTQRKRLESLEAEQKGLEASLKALGPRLSESNITVALKEVQALQERRRAATNRYKGLALLSEISKLTPDDVELLHISAAMGNSITLLDVPSKEEDSEDSVATEGSLLLKGLVGGEGSLPQTLLTIYLARLEQSPLFRQVEVAATEDVESPDGPRLAFTLKAKTTEKPDEKTPGQ